MKLPSKELYQTIVSDKLGGLTEEVIEIVIDEVSDSELIEEAPIMGTLKALYKTGQSIRDALFLKKALYVLLELSDVSKNKRVDFIESLEDRYSSGSEIILSAIDRLESNEKSVIFGRLCKIRAQKKITKKEFLELSKLIQDAYIPDLIEFYKTDAVRSGTVYNDSKFIRLGLISLLLEVDESKKLELIDDEYYAPRVALEGVQFTTDYSDLGSTFNKVYTDLFKDRV